LLDYETDCFISFLNSEGYVSSWDRRWQYENKLAPRVGRFSNFLAWYRRYVKYRK